MFGHGPNERMTGVARQRELGFRLARDPARPIARGIQAVETAHGTQSPVATKQLRVGSERRPRMTSQEGIGGSCLSQRTVGVSFPFIREAGLLPVFLCQLLAI